MDIKTINKNKDTYNLNSFFKGKVRFIRVLFEEPKIELSNVDYFDIKDDQEFKEKIEKCGHINEPHAVFKSIDEINWVDTIPIIKYQTIFYSELLTLNRKNLFPKIISCNALLLSNETGDVILHKRSKHSRYFKEKLHIFGGAFLTSVNRNLGDKSCWDATLREVMEETGINLKKGNYPIYLGEEIDTGYFQIVFLGIPISKSDLDKALSHRNWEGEIIKIPYQDIKNCIANKDDFVPSALMHIQCWLDLGAPGIDEKYKKFIS